MPKTSYLESTGIISCFWPGARLDLLDHLIPERELADALPPLGEKERDACVMSRGQENGIHQRILTVVYNLMVAVLDASGEHGKWRAKRTKSADIPGIGVGKWRARRTTTATSAFEKRTGDRPSEIV